MNLYLDACVLVSLFTEDVHSHRADEILANAQSPILVSDFAAAEFSSAVARLVRVREIDAAEARKALANFDVWRTQMQRVELASSDVAFADALLRRLDLPLRTPDAINIAIATRLGAILSTFDVQLAASARAIGQGVHAG